jgi:endonuclease/exonuclease/phosphatase family metal-dependent hydrolase
MRARFAVVLPIVLSIVGCGGSRTEPNAETSSANLSAGSMAGGNKVIGVMSRNLYLGADLAPVIAAQTLPNFLAATTAAWKMVQKNDFHLRAQELADEIAGKRPALVGLQEAFTWRTQTPADGTATPATTVVYDFVPELQAALAERGVKYRAVASVELLDVEAPTLLGIDVRATDHDVILAREDVHATKTAEVVYSHLLPLSILGQPFLLKRGYVAVDVKYRGEQLRFVDTHLESFHPLIRTAQGAELAASPILADASRPVILVGDLNSLPGTEGQAALLRVGFADVWPLLHPGNAGLTCCFGEDLTIPGGVFDQRIDYVLTRGPFEPRAAAVTGTNPAVRVEGLWPSDHGGIFAEVLIGDPRFDR